ncbi:MAG TPA: ABC transporter ATP-binding protein [Acidimicrobiales bacterium]|nr:ABC transporter ATP-binding protein [Acidimicrobiales bacterium]
MRTPAIELVGVHAAYGGIEVLHGVDLLVPEGSLVALLGPNGAGKSTMLKLIDGRLAPTRGHVHIAGRHVNGAQTQRLARAGVCSVPEGRGIFPNLTVAENLRMVTQLHPDLSLSEVSERTFARFPNLAQRRTQLAGTLSGGEQQMLAMARAIVSDPSVLLVDEPSMGLAPLIVADIYDVLRQLAAEGMTVLLVEQFAHMALSIADYAAVMAQGRILSFSEPADLGDVAGAYLGASA